MVNHSNNTVPRIIRVFIASPGDLVVERRAFKEVIDELNDGFGAGANVRFEALAWEDALAEVGRRPQDEINTDVDHCDVFILAMHRRWGTKDSSVPPPATSRTEEEFLRALDRRKQTNSPRMFLFFKNIDEASLRDPGPQLRKVLSFKKKMERSGTVFYRNFSDEAGFRFEVSRHLRDVAQQNELPTDAERLRPVILSLNVKALEQLLAEAEERTRRAEEALLILKAENDNSQDHKRDSRNAVEKLAFARAEELAIVLAERAAQAALNGRVEEARQDFAKAADGTNNFRVLFLSYEFYERIGDLTTAEETLERCLAIGGRDAQTPNTALAIRKLGLIFLNRGELKRAEELHQKSLAIEEKLGREEGMAADFGNLGLIYWMGGELNRAQEMLKKVLAIHSKLLGQNGISNTVNNRESVYDLRREMDRAEEILQKALIINMKFHRDAGSPHEFSIDGKIYLTTHELDWAEVLVRKSLDIDKKLDRHEGMAIRYDNLGLIYQTRGEMEEAEQLHRKALAIDETLGRPEGIAREYCNLGLIYQAHGDLNRAEEMHRQSLAIEEMLGRKERIALQCNNLGFVYRRRGELDRAEQMHRRSLSIDEKLHFQEAIASDYGNLGLVCKDRGDLTGAQEWWTNARDLFAKIGMPHRVVQVQTWLHSLVPRS